MLLISQNLRKTERVVYVWRFIAALGMVSAVTNDQVKVMGLGGVVGLGVTTSSIVPIVVRI